MRVEVDENPHSGMTIALLNSDFPGRLSMFEICSWRLAALIVEWLKRPVGLPYEALGSRHCADQAGRY